MNQIDQLKEIIKKYMPNPEQLNEVTPGTDFIRDLNINSADLIDVILDIEEEYDIVISDEGMQQMLSVQNALEIINKALSEKENKKESE